MSALDRDEILSRLGLATKASTGQTVLSVLGPFGLGMLVGAGVALLLAPKSGRELREDLRNKVSRENLTDISDAVIGDRGFESTRKPA